MALLPAFSCLNMVFFYNANNSSFVAVSLDMIERADINSVLSQMRQLQADAQQGIKSVNKLPIQPELQQVAKPEGESFGSLLKNAVDGVNKMQTESNRLATAYEKGDERVELTQVMVQMQKASLSFQAMTQVRNRLVAAYEDVMKMPI